jgi:hypothetical protein
VSAAHANLSLLKEALDHEFSGPHLNADDDEPKKKLKTVATRSPFRTSTSPPRQSGPPDQGLENRSYLPQ